MNFGGDGREVHSPPYTFIIQKNGKTTREPTLKSNWVSDPMLKTIPKSVHFLDYLNFGSLFDFFLWPIC